MAAAILVSLSISTVRGAEAGTGPEPVLKVTDPGKGERHELRFKIAKGWKESAVMLTRMEVTTEMPGLTLPPRKLPTPELDLRVEVTDVAEGGDFTYSFQFYDVRVKQEEGVSSTILEMLKTQLQSLKGLSGTAVVTNRGLARKVEVKIPDSATPQMRQTLESTLQSFKNFSMPMPEEPVGVGAKWEVSQEIETGGLKVHQVSSYEVVKIEGGQVQLKIEVKHSADPQDVKAPNPAAAAKLSLVSMDLRGTGEALLELQRVLPEKLEIQVGGEYKMRMDSGGQPREMTTKARMLTRLSRTE